MTLRTAVMLLVWPLLAACSGGGGGDAPPPVVTVDLIGTSWIVNGEDDAGVSWNNSSLVFTNQVATSTGFDVSGAFQWSADNGAFGGERFTGTMAPDGTLDLTGYQIVEPSNRIGLGRYRATMRPDGARIVRGTWVGAFTTTSPPGRWDARRGIVGGARLAEDEFGCAIAAFWRDGELPEALHLRQEVLFVVELELLGLAPTPARAELLAMVQASAAGPIGAEWPVLVAAVADGR